MEELRDKIYNTYARMSYYSEVDDSNGSNEYLYENLDNANNGKNWYGDGSQPTSNINGIDGYWTLSTNAETYFSAWFVIYSGSVDSVSVGYDAIGVRPVINLKL